MSAADDHAIRTHDLNRILTLRDAMEEAGLCGPDEGEEDGREAALALLEALARRRIGLVAMPAREPPPALPPTLGERLVAGALRLNGRLKPLAFKRPRRRAGRS